MGEQDPISNQIEEAEIADLKLMIKTFSKNVVTSLMRSGKKNLIKQSDDKEEKEKYELIFKLPDKREVSLELITKTKADNEEKLLLDCELLIFLPSDENKEGFDTKSIGHYGEELVAFKKLSRTQKAEDFKLEEIDPDPQTKRIENPLALEYYVLLLKLALGELENRKRLELKNDIAEVTSTIVKAMIKNRDSSNIELTQKKDKKIYKAEIPIGDRERSIEVTFSSAAEPDPEAEGLPDDELKISLKKIDDELSFSTEATGPLGTELGKIKMHNLPNWEKPKPNKETGEIDDLESLEQYLAILKILMEKEIAGNISELSEHIRKLLRKNLSLN